MDFHGCSRDFSVDSDGFSIDFHRCSRIWMYFLWMLIDFSWAIDFDGCVMNFLQVLVGLFIDFLYVFSWIVYGCSMDFDGLPVAWKSMNIHENLSRPMSLQQNPSQSMSNPSKSTKITPQIHEKTPINKSKIQQESIKIHPNSWTSIKTHGKSMVIQVTWR